MPRAAHPLLPKKCANRCARTQASSFATVMRIGVSLARHMGDCRLRGAGYGVSTCHDSGSISAERQAMQRGERAAEHDGAGLASNSCASHRNERRVCRGRLRRLHDRPGPRGRRLAAVSGDELLPDDAAAARPARCLHGRRPGCSGWRAVHIRCRRSSSKVSTGGTGLWRCCCSSAEPEAISDSAFLSISTGPMNRYPRPRSVAISRGAAGSSPRTVRSLLMDLCTPCS